MNGTGVIDNFLGVFTRYIDSGFGLVQGDVRWLASTLIVIDLTLAGLFWVLAPDEDVIARLVKKTLYIGLFAFFIGNFNSLAQAIYGSFAGLGIEAGSFTLTQTQLMQPGSFAQIGIDSGKPILDAISGLMGFASFFENFVQIAILLIAWLIVVLSFFIMAIQLFVSLIEFKLTTLAGFVLVPFGLFGRTAFLAEKVLGNVMASGVKVMVLAVIVGIGSTIFGQFTSGFNNPPTISDALTLSACERRRAAVQTSGANPDRQSEEGSFAVLALKLFWFFLDSHQPGGAFVRRTSGVKGEEAGEDFVFEVRWPVEAGLGRLAFVGFLLDELGRGAVGEIVPAIGT